jgi:hypothetical protein
LILSDVRTARNDNSQQNPSEHVTRNGVNVGELQQEKFLELSNDRVDDKSPCDKRSLVSPKSAKFINKLHVFSIEIITTSEFSCLIEFFLLDATLTTAISTFLVSQSRRISRFPSKFQT